MSKSPADFIAQKGARTVAEKVGRSLGAVRVWKHRNKFPRDAWPDLILAFPRELTLERLIKTENRGPNGGARQSGGASRQPSSA